MTATAAAATAPAWDPMAGLDVEMKQSCCSKRPQEPPACWEDVALWVLAPRLCWPGSAASLGHRHACKQNGGVAALVQDFTPLPLAPLRTSITPVPAILWTGSSAAPQIVVAMDLLNRTGTCTRLGCTLCRTFRHPHTASLPSALWGSNYPGTVGPLCEPGIPMSFVSRHISAWDLSGDVRAGPMLRQSLYLYTRGWCNKQMNSDRLSAKLGQGGKPSTDLCYGCAEHLSKVALSPVPSPVLQSSRAARPLPPSSHWEGAQFSQAPNRHVDHM